MSLGSLSRAAVGVAMHWSGVGRAFEMAARPAGAIILMYHSVAPDAAAPYIEPVNRMHPRLFERQMAFLAAERHVLPLSELVAKIAAGRSPPAGTVCITLDDGYLDNLTTAAPVLERYRLPATLFIATGLVERAETQWSDTLHWLFGCATRHTLSLRMLGSRQMNLAARSEKARAYSLLHQHLLEAEHAQRVELLADIRCQLAPAGKPPRVSLDWDEVHQLRRRYPFLDIGGHTRDHIDLRKHRGEAARLQIAGCAADLRRELGGARHFSYPYERWCDESRQAVVDGGWASAVGVGAPLRVGAHSDRYAMPRVHAPHAMTQLAFYTSGAYPGALALLGFA
jgi:peptidoglycan/xylan/chitin deacetylase (PgdA/CDA1 family)